MLLSILSLLLMALVAYAFLREGVFTAFMMFCNVFISGVVAFNFFEPIAAQLESPLSGTFLAGYEDFFCLITIFTFLLGVLRTATNAIANVQISFPTALQRGGGVVLGLGAGYLLTGFLICTLQTLPWHGDFCSFDANFDPKTQPSSARILPPDKMWLAMMYRAGAFTFANYEEPSGSPNASAYDRFYTFDRGATFELRYRRFRRRDEIYSFDPNIEAGLHGSQR